MSVGPARAAVCLAFLLVSVTAASGASRAVPERDASLHVLALARLSTPPELHDAERARQIFQPLILEQLGAAGFVVIPPDRVQAARAMVPDSMNAPLHARAEAQRAVLERLDADALVEPELILTREASTQGTVHWYGAKADVPRGDTRFEAVYAYAIRIVVTARDGSVVHRGTGGIEPTPKPDRVRDPEAYVTLPGSVSLSHSVHVEGKQAFFRDRKRNWHAVRFALTPFAAAEAPQK